jgi:hypothetical protein
MPSIIYMYAQNDQLEQLKKTLADPENKYETEPDGTTPLAIAAEKGHYVIVEYLLSSKNPKQAEVLATIDATSGVTYHHPRSTALWTAAYYNHFTVMHYLLKAGASPNVESQYKTTNGFSYTNSAFTVTYRRTISNWRATALLLIYGAKPPSHELRNLNQSALTSALFDLMITDDFTKDPIAADRCLAFLETINVLRVRDALINEPLAQIFSEQNKNKLQQASTALARCLQHHLQEKKEFECKRQSHVDLAELAVNPIQRELCANFEMELQEFVKRKTRIAKRISQSQGRNYKKRLDDFAKLVAEIENIYYQQTTDDNEKVTAIKLAFTNHANYYATFPLEWIWDAATDDYYRFLQKIPPLLKQAADEVILEFAETIATRLAPYHARDYRPNGEVDATLLAVVRDMEQRARFSICNKESAAAAPPLPPFPPRLAAQVGAAARSPVFSAGNRNPLAATPAAAIANPAVTVSPKT